MFIPAGWPAFWGLLGAAIYAAPKLTTCFYASAGRAHLSRCAIEAATALFTGTIAAAAFEPWIGAYLRAVSVQDMRATSAVIGMLANSTAPGIIAFLGDTVLTRIKGGH